MTAPVALRGPVGQRVRAPKTAELIASHLRGQIVRGELATGETLPSEAALTETFGVSRPTLREAFRILEAESLINVRRGARGGARVVAPDVAVAARYAGLLLQVTHTTIADVQAARVLREVVAMHLRTAAPRTSGRPGTREELRKTVRSYRKLVVLLDARNAEGAQHHWRAHLEAASRELLRGGLDPQAVVDLFG